MIAATVYLSPVSASRTVTVSLSPTVPTCASSLPRIIGANAGETRSSFAVLTDAAHASAGDILRSRYSAAPDATSARTCAALSGGIASMRGIEVQ